jgi:hypothetical protein
MGVSEIYTDNVFRTNTNRQSDFIHSLAPGIQVQLPFLKRHAFVVDYRTNIQYFQRTPTNDVQDQTAVGRFQFDLPSGLKIALQGEHKLGHDPRGSAIDIQALEVNKWQVDSFSARADYQGARTGVSLTAHTGRWTYLNNNQGPINDRMSNLVGLTLSRQVLPRTSLLADFRVQQAIFDQNKNLDSAIYTGSVGAEWTVTGKTKAELLVGYQWLKFTRAQVNQPGPVLSVFRRDRDDFSNLFVAGNLTWKPTTKLTINVQPYRAIQQIVVSGSTFFTATGVNLAASHALTPRVEILSNVGIEHDKFEVPAGLTGTTPARSDTLQNVAFGVSYRAVKWIGVTGQYIFEHRQSEVSRFSYNANTFMLAVQAVL